MKVSFSKIKTYDQCPYKYKLKHIDKLKTKFNEEPTNALILGTAIHEGIEKDNIIHALDTYRAKYSIWDDRNEVEMIKLESVLPKALTQIPRGEYEYKLDTDEFIGFIDLLVKVDDGVYDLYDFKYSNAAGRYKKSGQVHVYKYYYEKLTGNKIRKMYYAMVPKSKVELKEGMSLSDAKSKILDELSDKDIKFEEIEYDKKKVGYFFNTKRKLEGETEFNRRYNTFCGNCEYAIYCRTNGQNRSEIDEANTLLQLQSEICE